MFNQVSTALPSFNRAEKQADLSKANSVFRVLHGFYGNLFLNKFANGQLTKEKEDQGVISAKAIWAHGLHGFELSTIKTALGVCQTAHQEFPPSLPQFIGLCRAAQPRVTYKPSGVAVGMSQELRSAYARKVREINERHNAKALARRSGFVELPATLDGLKQAIAQAVSLAGGDEAKELRRLDTMLMKRAAV
jgi:hypothetical protein